MSKDNKVIVCYHKESDIFENDCLLPLHVGATMNPNILVNMQGDNDGENISDKNGSYCELTGLYWLWKNVDADNYGLFHYRRFLDIKNKYNNHEYFSKINISDYDSKSFEKIMSKYDVILPKKSKLKTSLYEHYRKSHKIKDLDIVIEIIKQNYPQWELSMQKALKATGGGVFQ